MKTFAPLTIAVASLALAACTDPSCLPDEIQVGNQCRKVRGDAGDHDPSQVASAGADSGSDTPWHMDASTPDSATPTSDGATPVEDAQSAQDANSAEDAQSAPDASCTATTCLDDGNPCTVDAVIDCACTHQMVTVQQADGCCLAGETAIFEHACTGCGNGKVEAGEQCDDSNVTPLDGCDAACQVENNLSTFGDDRPKRIQCDSKFCEVGQYCNIAFGQPTTFTCSSGGYASIYNGYQLRCDGPEDCPAGNLCVLVNQSQSDTPNTDCMPPPNGYAVVCHKSSDCTAPKSQCAITPESIGVIGNCR